MVRVAIPVQLKLVLKSNFPLSRKDEVLNWPLFKMQILELKNPESLSLSPFKTEFISINDLIENMAGSISQNSSGGFEVHFGHIMMSKSFLLPAGINYRIRLEWSSDGICGEKEFSLQLGDQIRVVRSVE